MDGVKACAIRLYMGESMEEFSKRIGVAASTISDVENGHRDVSDRVRAKLIRLELQMPEDFYAFYDKFRNKS
jgi:transcriptional regulator with XRE-family HTH domain